MTFKLKSSVGADYNHDLDDVFKAKRTLKDLGHFETPDYGLTEYPDQPLFDGVKSFQKAHGLKTDGIMKSGGETERAIGKAIAPADTRSRGTAAEQPDRTTPDRLDHTPKPEPDGRSGRIFDTAGQVGWGRKNAPRDVLATRRALAWTGHLPNKPAGDSKGAGNDLFQAIEKFQGAAGVKRDGWMGNGGETARALDAAIAPKVQAYLKSVAGNDRGENGEIDRSNEGTDVAMMRRRRQPGNHGFTEGSLPTNPWVSGGSAAMLGSAVAAQEILRQNAKRHGAPGEVPDVPSIEPGSRRTDIAGPTPRTPPLQADDDPKVTKTVTPANPTIVEMDLSHPVPEKMGPGIYVHPVPPEDLTNGTIIERKGNEATRKELERIRDHYEGLGWKHQAGGRYSEKNELVKTDRKKIGDEQKERHIPGPGKAWKSDSRQGGHFTDLTFKTPDGRTVHIQSVDVDRNGKPTKRELDAAERIRRAEQDTDVYLIPKGAQLKRRKILPQGR